MPSAPALTWVIQLVKPCLRLLPAHQLLLYPYAALLNFFILVLRC